MTPLLVLSGSPDVIVPLPLLVVSGSPDVTVPLAVDDPPEAVVVSEVGGTEVGGTEVGGTEVGGTEPPDEALSLVGGTLVFSVGETDVETGRETEMEMESGGGVGVAPVGLVVGAISVDRDPVGCAEMVSGDELGGRVTTELSDVGMSGREIESGKLING